MTLYFVEDDESFKSIEIWSCCPDSSENFQISKTIANKKNESNIKNILYVKTRNKITPMVWCRRIKGVGQRDHLVTQDGQDLLASPTDTCSLIFPSTRFEDFDL